MLDDDTIYFPNDNEYENSVPEISAQVFMSSFAKFRAPNNVASFRKGNAGLVREWGSTWSNRTYSRAIQLDREGISADMVRLTRAEDNAATRALHFAIMAFATQWAQGSHLFNIKFGRKLKVLFKMWKAADSIGISPCGSDLKTEVLSRLRVIISKEGPPIYMERAARKVQALQARYNASRRGLGPPVVDRKNPTRAIGNSQFFLNNEHGETAGLLYWFAVMFDTVSSSMNERPVVVPDEDIPHPSGEDLYDYASNQSNERWDIRAFLHDDVENPTYSPKWPCPYEDAAKAVAKAAPVKVLWFRHLCYLQIYRYWNKTYGSFFREMMLDIYSIPARIRSWFFCISCHWNLAALMVADLITFVDENNLGMDTETYTRISSKTAWRIRDAAVKELAELARHSAWHLPYSSEKQMTLYVTVL
ncbi:hypothetical protein Trco_008492 [Trichoderma cornu-damae]|uniref:Uncharacterized protein n=1 Tax=Trichoderma cornu-damae TaxID=654480 RepID=A0A9P8QJY5_9HYPO|nr:hypothetical protein Trco_008492 [Trichoderma cornu-damae]